MSVEAEDGLLISREMMDEFVAAGIRVDPDQPATVQVPYHDGSERKIWIKLESPAMAEVVANCLNRLTLANLGHAIHQALWRVANEAYGLASDETDDRCRRMLKDLSDRLARTSFMVKPEPLFELTKLGFKQIEMGNLEHPELM